MEIRNSTGTHIGNLTVNDKDTALDRGATTETSQNIGLAGVSKISSDKDNSVRMLNDKGDEIARFNPIDAKLIKTGEANGGFSIEVGEGKNLFTLMIYPKLAEPSSEVISAENMQIIANAWSQPSLAAKITEAMMKSIADRMQMFLEEMMQKIATSTKNFEAQLKVSELNMGAALKEAQSLRTEAKAELAAATTKFATQMASAAVNVMQSVASIGANAYKLAQSTSINSARAEGVKRATSDAKEQFANSASIKPGKDGTYTFTAEEQLKVNQLASPKVKEIKDNFKAQSEDLDARVNIANQKSEMLGKASSTTISAAGELGASIIMAESKEKVAKIKTEAASLKYIADLLNAEIKRNEESNEYRTKSAEVLQSLIEEALRTMANFTSSQAQISSNSVKN